MGDVKGFSAYNEDGYTSEAELDTRALVQEQNRKKKKSGGFQSMGLSHSIFNGVMKKGYKVPTPIQRKCIPLIMEGKDVVAMARTGSGKTACFLIPLFEKLQARSAKAGARALIMSPTRELALQTLRFTRELGRYTGLKAATVLGGDSMEAQFAAIHENPDIIIATPGRFAHLCVEMELKLKDIQYVVFDEADRLFEMGFGEQLLEVLKRLPDNRQTLLFSATLPKMLVEFTKAGLSDPVLLRLDVDTRLPENLHLAFAFCPSEAKPAALLHLLKNVVKKGELTLVFAATMHHVEYLHLLLDKAGVPNSYLYSSLDPAARKIHAAKFQNKIVHVLVTTDIAARGIDIPLLDNVINYNFPAKSKLFVHRVGRVARAGRAGTAFSLIALDEVAYYVDLQLFLGRPVKSIPQEGLLKKEEGQDEFGPIWDGYLGRIAHSVMDDFGSVLEFWHKESIDLANMVRVCNSAYKQYKRSCPAPSHESVKRGKAIPLNTMGFHPLFVTEDEEGVMGAKRLEILQKMKNFKPQSTIFEIGVTQDSLKAKIMREKRKAHEATIAKFHRKLDTDKEEREGEDEEEEFETGPKQGDDGIESATAEDLENAFQTVIAPRKRKNDQPFEAKKTAKKAKLEKGVFDFKDKEHYIPYSAANHHLEAGLSLVSDFNLAAADAVMDLTADEDQELRRQRSMLRWDRKKQKYIGTGQEEKNRKIRTESGVWIPASYKTDRYERWVSKTKADQIGNGGENGEDAGDAPPSSNRQFRSYRDDVTNTSGMNLEGSFSGLPRSHPAMVKAWSQGTRGKAGHMRHEIKRPDEILKARKEQEKKFLRNGPKDKRQQLRNRDDRGGRGGRGGRGRGSGGGRDRNDSGRGRGGGGRDHNDSGRGRGRGGGGGRGGGRGGSRGRGRGR